MKRLLETNRLQIKPFTKADATRVQQLANNIEVANIIGLPHPYLLEHAESWINIQPGLIEEGTEYPLAIFDKSLDVIVGTITLRIDKVNNKGELGYWIGRDYWGCGYATEAVNRMIEFGFHDLQLNKIWAAAIVRNQASIRVLEKAGLQREGILRQHKKLLDKYEDIVVLGLLKEEYK